MLDQIHTPIAGRSRFYKIVSVRPVESDGCTESEAYEITLDGRALKTPARRPMHFSNKFLAQAVALEWDAQGLESNEDGEAFGIQPTTMPLMSLTATWLDQTSNHPDIVIKNMLRFLNTDTCCFYADSEQRALVRRQKQKFGRILQWLEEEWGIKLNTTDTLFKVAHPPEAISKLKALLAALDPEALTALQSATMESKSLLLSLALILRHIPPEDAGETCRLEEEFQMEQWGLVEGGHDLDRVATTVQLTSASLFLHMVDGTDGHAHRLNRLKSALSGV